MKMAATIACLVLLAACPLPVWAWGELGHRIVCEIAFQELNDKARQEVRRLIRLDPEFRTFADACTWPDHPQQRAAEHFVNVPRDFIRFTEPRCPMAAPCVFTAIDADLKVLRSSASSQAKLASLKFLGHWVGDIHQPLHVSFQDDRGGNRIQSAGPCPGSLHGAWDICLVELGIGGAPLGVAHTLRKQITPEQRQAWRAAPVVAWANESFDIARRPSARYCVREGSACAYGPGNARFSDGEMERVVPIDAAYIRANAPVVATRLKQAGVRLGAMLNGSLGQ
jgi:hypothetical protein